MSAERKIRYANNRKDFDRMLLIAGNDFSSNLLRELKYDRPEEDTVPCSFEQPWCLSEIGFNSFATREILEHGIGNTYIMYKIYLQLLQWQTESRSSSLKTWILTCTGSSIIIVIVKQISKFLRFIRPSTLLS